MFFFIIILKNTHNQVCLLLHKFVEGMLTICNVQLKIIFTKSSYSNLKEKLQIININIYPVQFLNDDNKLWLLMNTSNPTNSPTTPFGRHIAVNCPISDSVRINGINTILALNVGSSSQDIGTVNIV